VLNSFRKNLKKQFLTTAAHYHLFFHCNEYLQATSVFAGIVLSHQDFKQPLFKANDLHPVATKGALWIKVWL